MASYRGTIRTTAQTQREAERQKVAHERAMLQTTHDMASARAQYENGRLESDVMRLQTLLTAALSVDDYLDFTRLKIQQTFPAFDPGPEFTESEPDLHGYLPIPPTGIGKLLPGPKKRYAEDWERAKETHARDVQRWQQRRTTWHDQRAARRASYEREVASIQAHAAAQHAQVDTFRHAFDSGESEAIMAYFRLVLESSDYPNGFPRQAKVAYVLESKQLVVEYDLPAFEVAPAVASFKYVKAKDEITPTARPLAQRKALYASVVSQVALRTLHELFEADRTGHLQVIVFNGHVNTIDPATGQPVRPCLITVRVTRDIFSQLDLRRVDPAACLKMLNASVSKSPMELAPVRPVVEFDMVDPRFIEKPDVLAGLDQRQNLMELTPGEFEALIANLFQKMGLETHLTQASRDGGVDCVAYDPRPIVGGKIVIQAKRYRHTVGVSAVRDLFGTVQNEGASKGILVTTSGYGKAAFEFAQGKSLELLSGSNLLALLADYAGLEAKIEIPPDWKDAVADSAEQ